jgi:hypothetical protein
VRVSANIEPVIIYFFGRNKIQKIVWFFQPGRSGPLMMLLVLYYILNFNNAILYITYQKSYIYFYIYMRPLYTSGISAHCVPPSCLLALG